jgi:hypothetical protein
MSADTNRAKGTLPLADYHVKRRLDEFFRRGDRVTLGHLLRFLKDTHEIENFGQVIEAVEHEGIMELRSASGTSRSPLCTCPATGWKYFYATVPVDVIESDDESDHSIGLQPRYLIPERVFELYRHFQRHPVLLPSIGRIVGNRLRMFDGQHKIAGLLWTGRREFEVKIYVTCDIGLLNDTNISAHDKFAQARFYSSIMVMKLGTQFGKDFDDYKKDEAEGVKSEAGFLKFLALRDAGMVNKAGRNAKFRSYLYNSVIESPDNKARKLISAGNKSTNDKPLTIDMLGKSIFACFMYRDPVDDNLTTDAYKRQTEVENVTALMNMMYELGLHAWNPHALAGNTTQFKLTRMFRSKSIMAWSEILADAIAPTLKILSRDEKAKLFYRELSKEQHEAMKAVVSRLFGWKFWADANGDIDRVLADNKSEVKQWFAEHGLDAGYLMGVIN